MGKLPNEVTEAEGEKIIKEKEQMSLASLKEWLDLKRKACALTQRIDAPSASTSAGNRSKFEIGGSRTSYQEHHIIYSRNIIRAREEFRRTRTHVLQSQQN